MPPEPWRVEEPPPDDVVPLLGIWFMEGEQLVFSWRKGTLEARFPDDPDWEEPAVFERERADRWRVVSGWEHGELLRIEPDRLVLSGYPVTRVPGPGCNGRYSYCSASSTFSRPARRAGKIAATSPAMIAAT